MSWVLPSLKVPVATNCWTLPAGAVTVAGVTASETRVPLPTVKVVVPVTPDADAEIVTVPAFLPCAIPVERIEAMFGLEDFQVSPLRFEATLPSLNVPVAVNLITVLLEILGLAGFMVMETSWEVETVRVVEPLTEPKSALMVVAPGATLVARPCPLMVATAEVEEVQTTIPVMSCVLESLKVPVAVNCLVVPTAMLGFAGVTATETNVAAVIVSEAGPLIEPEVAVSVAVPVPTAVTSPLVLTVATEFEDELQVSEVSSCVLPSSKLPTAVNC